MYEEQLTLFTDPPLIKNRKVFINFLIGNQTITNINNDNNEKILYG